MTLTEQIASTIKPILDEHMREARERIARLERDINDARAHLEISVMTFQQVAAQLRAERNSAVDELSHVREQMSTQMAAIERDLVEAQQSPAASVVQVQP